MLPILNVAGRDPDASGRLNEPRIGLSPEAPDLCGLGFGAFVARFQRRFDLPRVEQVHARRRAGDDEHAFGAGGL